MKKLKIIGNILWCLLKILIVLGIFSLYLDKFQRVTVGFLVLIYVTISFQLSLFARLLAENELISLKRFNHLCKLVNPDFQNRKQSIEQLSNSEKSEEQEVVENLKLYSEEYQTDEFIKESKVKLENKNFDFWINLLTQWIISIIAVLNIVIAVL